MREKQRNQPLEASGRFFWPGIFVLSIISYLILLSAAAFLSDRVMSAAVSIIVIPLLFFVFSFYKWLYCFFASMRLSQSAALYQGSRLYRAAEMTAGSGTGARLNTVFSICLIFSAASFVFGTILLRPGLSVFGQEEQKWMGFLQYGICLIFLVIYFFTLSLLQMIDLRRETRNFQLLFYMGKNRTDLKLLLCAQTLVKLLLPALTSFFALWITEPFVNYKVNSLLPASMHNLLFHALCGFLLCFLALYFFYFCAVYLVSSRAVKPR